MGLKSLDVSEALEDVDIGSQSERGVGIEDVSFDVSETVVISLVSQLTTRFHLLPTP